MSLTNNNSASVRGLSSWCIHFLLLLIIYNNYYTCTACPAWVAINAVFKEMLRILPPATFNICIRMAIV